MSCYWKRVTWRQRKGLHAGNRTRCEEPLLVTEGRLAQRSFSSSSITWFIALFSHVSTETPICFSRSRRASAFSLIIWGKKEAKIRTRPRLHFTPRPVSITSFPDPEITRVAQKAAPSRNESSSSFPCLQKHGVRPRGREELSRGVKLQAYPISQGGVFTKTPSSH